MKQDHALPPAAAVEAEAAGRAEADGPKEVTAESLRVGFRAMIVEADEWRPLARYINMLLALARRG